MHKVTLQDRIFKLQDRFFKLPQSLLGGIALMLFLLTVLRCFIVVFFKNPQYDFLAYLEVSSNLFLAIRPV